MFRNLYISEVDGRLFVDQGQHPQMGDTIQTRNQQIRGLLQVEHPKSVWVRGSDSLWVTVTTEAE